MTRLKRALLFSIFLILFFDSSAAYDDTVVKGETFTMPCYDDIASPNPSGFFVELTFTQLGSSTSKVIGKYEPSSMLANQIPAEFTDRLSFNPPNHVTIADIRVEDEGLYMCTARAFSVDGEPIKSTNLVVHVRPTIAVTLIDSPLQAGSGLVEAASCSALGGKPTAEVSWSTERFLLYNESTTKRSGEEAKTEDHIVTLSVDPTRFYNDQPFICTIRHSTLPDGFNKTTVQLDVLFSPSLPSIEVINDNTQLRCEAKGNPDPVITWIMPNGNTAPNPTPKSSTVRIISPEDPARQNDTYICQAGNGIAPSTEYNITTVEAVHYVAAVKTGNAGAIVGIVIGCILILAIIGAAVYWFFIRKKREKDSESYPSKKIVRPHQDDEDGWGRSSGRPMIQHANESLNKNAPPSPSRPPPHEDDEGSNYSQSDVEEFTEGHDVDLNSPATDPEDNHMPTAGIVSKNSVNFQHRRQRPSTSPHSRKSQTRSQPQPSPRTPQMTEPHYEEPPKDYYEDDYEQEEGRLMQDPHFAGDRIDDRFYDRPEDRYPGYQQRYDEPPMDEHLPPYTDTVQYASLDHSYDGGKSRTRPPYQEPVEYAEIRSKGQIV